MNTIFDELDITKKEREIFNKVISKALENVLKKSVQDIIIKSISDNNGAKEDLSKFINCQT